MSENLETWNFKLHKDAWNQIFNQWSRNSGIKELRSQSYFVIEESSRAGSGAVAYLCLLQNPVF